MRRKIIMSVILILLIIILGYKHYINNYSNEGIFNNVTDRNGYILNQVQESVKVKLFIKPEWIPFNSDEIIEMNEKLLEVHSTNIILSRVWNRGNDIYFSFETTYNMNYSKGEFLYNGTFNENGTFSWVSKMDGIKLYDKRQKIFEKGQHGRGPNSAFGFGIEPESYKDIEEGFYIDYTEFILYKYIKK
ncbi:hypothetical protein AN1V17_16380 [Vallitalea sediminicola]